MTFSLTVEAFDSEPSCHLLPSMLDSVSLLLTSEYASFKVPALENVFKLHCMAQNCSLSLVTI